MTGTLGDIFEPGINNGLKLLEYRYSDIVPGVLSGMRLDLIGSSFDAAQIESMVERGAIVIMHVDQLPADQMSTICLNGIRKGGAVHLIDRNPEENRSDSLSRILRSGGHLYCHNGVNRSAFDYRALAGAAANGGYLFLYPYVERPDITVANYRDVAVARGDLEIRLPPTVLTPIDISTVLEGTEFHGYEEHLSDTIFSRLSGMDTSLYDAGLFNLIGYGQMFDGRNDGKKEYMEFTILARRGCSLILNSTQFNPLELGNLARLFREKGGRLHLIDHGNLMPDQIGEIGSDGAFIYYHDGISRRRGISDLATISKLASRGGRFIYFDYSGYLDVGSMEGIVTSGGIMEYRAIRPFSHIVTIQSAQSRKGLASRAILDYIHGDYRVPTKYPGVAMALEDKEYLGRIGRARELQLAA